MRCLPFLIVRNHCYFLTDIRYCVYPPAFHISFFFMLFSDDMAKRIYLKLLCLPLLPAKDIRSAFTDLKKQAKERQMVRNAHGAFDHFLEYYHHQWISGSRHVSMRKLLHKCLLCNEYNSVITIPHKHSLKAEVL